jgi:hypothetical protein
MQPIELAHPHDLLVRCFLTDPELMADLLQYYPQNAADQQMVKMLDLKHLECKSPVTIDEKLIEKIGDLRYSASFRGSERKSNVFLLFEHQSEIDHDFRIRGLDYITQSYKEFRRVTKGNQKLPYPLVVVLYHGKVPWKHLPEMDELIDITPGVKTGLLDYQLILIDISVLSKDQFKGHPALQAVLELLQLASEKKLAAEFDRIIARLIAVKNDRRVGSWLTSFAWYAMSVAKIGVEQIVQAFSKLINEKEARNMAMTTAEELRIEGGAKVGRNMVLKALRTKFAKVPEGIEAAVLTMSDPIALESLLEQVFHSNTLDEFATALK